MPSKVWDEITYSFPNLNGCTVEIGEWISNFTPYFITDVTRYGDGTPTSEVTPVTIWGDLITYPYWD